MLGRTLVYIASENGHLDVVKCLVDNKADVHKANNDGKQTRHRAAHALSPNGGADRVESGLVLGLFKVLAVYMLISGMRVGYVQIYTHPPTPTQTHTHTHTHTHMHKT